MRAEHIPNNIVNPETGFLESPAYSSQFDSIRKKQFLELYRNNGMGLFRTCRALNLSCSTIHKHYAIDPEFKKQFDEAKLEYGDELEATSRQNALNPRSVIERIFQLKAIFPEKYGDRRDSGATQITLNIDGKVFEKFAQRDQILDAEIVPELKTQTLDNPTNLSANKSE